MATRYHLQNNSDFGGGAGRPWKRTSGLATERGCPPSGLARERGTEPCETHWKVDRTEPCEPNRIKQAQLEDIDIECNCVGFLGVTYSASLWATVGVRDFFTTIYSPFGVEWRWGIRPGSDSLMISRASKCGSWDVRKSNEWVHFRDMGFRFYRQPPSKVHHGASSFSSSPVQRIISDRCPSQSDLGIAQAQHFSLFRPPGIDAMYFFNGRLELKWLLFGARCGP